jgi:hypothetical protein
MGPCRPGHHSRGPRTHRHPSSRGLQPPASGVHAFSQTVGLPPRPSLALQGRASPQRPSPPLPALAPTRSHLAILAHPLNPPTRRYIRTHIGDGYELPKGSIYHAFPRLANELSKTVFIGTTFEAATPADVFASRLAKAVLAPRIPRCACARKHACVHDRDSRDRRRWLTAGHEG